MALKEVWKKFIRSTKDKVEWRVDPAEGIDFIFDKSIIQSPESHVQDNPYLGLQLAYLKGLHEQALAEKNANGFTIPSDVVPGLEDDFFDLFELPKPYPGTYMAQIDGNTGRANFSLKLSLQLNGETIHHYTLNGPFLKFTDTEQYRLSAVEWQALKAIKDHQQCDEIQKGEFENNWLMFQLELAKNSGMPIDLGHFDHLELTYPEKIGVNVEEDSEGNLLLTPSYGSGIDIHEVKKRLGQFNKNQDHAIFKVGQKFILLDKERLEATKEILTNRNIPKEQVANFLKSPTAYINAALIDLDTGFSLRVHGAERFTHRYFGDVEKSGMDWFAAEKKLTESIDLLPSMIDSQQKFDEIAEEIHDAQRHGADTVEYDDRCFDISDEDRVTATLSEIKEKIDTFPEVADDERGGDEESESKEKAQAVLAIDANDDEDDFGWETSLSQFNIEQQIFAEDNLKRTPYAHQREGIHWLLAHFEDAERVDTSRGALLADDMGLGKTYMALVAIAEWYRRKKHNQRALKPTLIIAPLSLIENWLAEVEDTFIKSPFSDIVVLQSGSQLKEYRIKGAGRETIQEFDPDSQTTEQQSIRYSLKIGKAYGTDRLDLPGRLVLSTYQTFRDYQFSLGRIDWSIAVFDEAQNIKNPNALATIAAKGLKADFKLLASGTPVENSLKDFWCLLDTAIPGLLGSWKSFRTTYITPILKAHQDEVNAVKIEIGKVLRDKVGDYMLRRTKEEHLDGLPAKKIFSGDQREINGAYLPHLAGELQGAQLQHYDEIIAQVKTADKEDKRKIVLPSLLRLKLACIHHQLDHQDLVRGSAKELLQRANESVKIKSLIHTLKQIEKKQEKVLIFATSKSVQAFVSVLVQILFKVPADIINGETKAVAKKKDDLTRKSMLDAFQDRPGFGAMIMSPVAAGVGLTVVGANHVIHLERHWNPAKEAQATDRVYRIGQTKEVHVYIPIVHHPDIASFDLQLNQLLLNKVDLSEAVVSEAVIEASDLTNCFESN